MDKPNISSVHFTVHVPLTVTTDNLHELARSVLSTFDDVLEKQMPPFGCFIPLSVRHEIFKAVYDYIMNDNSL